MNFILIFILFIILFIEQIYFLCFIKSCFIDLNKNIISSNSNIIKSVSDYVTSILLRFSKKG